MSSEFIALQPTLTQAVNDLNLSLTEQQIQQLLYYLQQLLFWNKAYNLTAIKQPKQALVKHIIDSLAILPHLPAVASDNNKLLDIGTGAGLPAVIVAICQPQRMVTALDSNGKKIRFIKQVASELGLTNITPVASRIEEHQGSYAVVTSRAFASLIDFVKVSEPQLEKQGEIWAMKGIEPTQEIQQLTNDWQIESIHLNVPMLDEERHLIKFIKN